ncbi:MAG: hypothetical protein ACRD09_06495 [Vicinamibacterales bacterium]
MVRRALLIAWVVVLAASGSLEAGQEQPGTQQVRLRDGSVLFGTVEVSGDDHIVFRTIGGAEVRIARDSIVSIAPATGDVVAGEFRPADPNATRLLFAPTGRALKRGDGYFGVYEFVMPFVQVGLTDRISIGGGTPLLFGLDESERPFWVTPKVQIVNGRRVQAAAGVMHIVAPEVGSLGIAYGVVTTGRPDASLTVGVGAGYRRNEGDNGATTIFMIGGERGLRSGIKFVTENYIWTGGDGILSGGIRFFGDRLSADVALFAPIGIDDLIVLPVVNVVWTF